MKKSSLYLIAALSIFIMFACASKQNTGETLYDDEGEEDPFAEADAIYNEAMRVEAEGNSEEALSYYLGAVDEYEKIGVTDCENWGYAHYYIGLIYMEMEEHALSAEHFGKSYKILKKALGRDDPQVAQILTYKGVMEKDNGDIEEAMKSFTRALEIREKEDPPDENQIRILKMNISDIREGW